MAQGVDQGVGARIKRLREEKNWSMAKLAVEADMSVSGVSMIENGKRNLTTTTLAKLARALDVEVADLFPKAQASLPDLEDERRIALEQLFENLRIRITSTADRWIHAAETGLMFWSEDAALAYSIEMNTEAAQLFGFVSEALEPALERLLAGTLTLRSEQRKLIEAMERLNKAVEAANAAADAVAPPKEPTEEEWAAFAEIAERLWEEMDEVKQRRLLREVAEVLAAECEQAAADRRGRIA